MDYATVGQCDKAHPEVARAIDGRLFKREGGTSRDCDSRRCEGIDAVFAIPRAATILFPGTAWNSFLCSKGRGTSSFASVQILFAMNHRRRSDGALFPDCPLNRDSESCFEGLMIPGGTVDCTRALPEPIRRAPSVAASPGGFFGGGSCGLSSDRARSGPLPASRADSARSGTGCIKPSIQG